MTIFNIPSSGPMDALMSTRYVKEMGVSSEACPRCQEMSVMFVRWREMKVSSLLSPTPPANGQAEVRGFAVPAVEYQLCFHCVWREVRAMRKDGSWGKMEPRFEDFSLDVVGFKEQGDDLR